MQRIAVSLAAALLFLGGCATTGATPEPSVLSDNVAADKVVAKADEAAVAGDYLAAATLYRHALTIEPDVEVWYRYGMALVMQEEMDQAMWAFRNALALDPEHKGSLQRIALYLTSKGQVDEATAYLERLLSVDPDNWRAHNALGVVSDLEERLDDAAVHYQAAIDLNPDNPMLWNNLGYSRYLADDFAEAQENFEKALELNPRYRPARRNLALLYARQEAYADALKMMLSAEDEATAFTDVGLLALKLGHYEQAELLLSEAVSRSPTYNAEASRGLSAVRKAIRRAEGSS